MLNACRNYIFPWSINRLCLPIISIPMCSQTLLSLSYYTLLLLLIWKLNSFHCSFSVTRDSFFFSCLTCRCDIRVDSRWWNHTFHAILLWEPLPNLNSWWLCTFKGTPFIPIHDSLPPVPSVHLWNVPVCLFLPLPNVFEMGCRVQNHYIYIEKKNAINHVSDKSAMS